MSRIILAFQGTGKTYFCNNETEKQCKDLDFKEFVHCPGWIKDYVDELERCQDRYDIIFCNISKDLMDELSARDIPFTVVTPIWYTNRGQDDDYRTLKEIIFGRFVLRKEQTPSNVRWLEKIKANFDNWTNFNMFKPYIDDGIADIIPMTVEKNSLSQIFTKGA